MARVANLDAKLLLQPKPVKRQLPPPRVLQLPNQLHPLLQKRAAPPPKPPLQVPLLLQARNRRTPPLPLPDPVWRQVYRRRPLLLPDLLQPLPPPPRLPNRPQRGQLPLPKRPPLQPPLPPLKLALNDLPRQRLKHQLHQNVKKRKLLRRPPFPLQLLQPKRLLKPKLKVRQPAVRRPHVRRLIARARPRPLLKLPLQHNKLLKLLRLHPLRKPTRRRVTLPLLPDAKNRPLAPNRRRPNPRRARPPLVLPRVPPVPPCRPHKDVQKRKPTQQRTTLPDAPTKSAGESQPPADFFADKSKKSPSSHEAKAGVRPKKRTAVPASAKAHSRARPKRRRCQAVTATPAADPAASGRARSPAPTGTERPSTAATP